MSHDDLTPAPGRIPIRLDDHWTAVVLHPVPDLPVAFIGLFLGKELEVFIEDPAEVRRLLRVLRLAQPGRRAPPKSGILTWVG